MSTRGCTEGLRSLAHLVGREAPPTQRLRLGRAERQGVRGEACGCPAHVGICVAKQPQRVREARPSARLALQLRVAARRGRVGQVQRRVCEAAGVLAVACSLNARQRRRCHGVEAGHQGRQVRRQREQDGQRRRLSLFCVGVGSG